MRVCTAGVHHIRVRRECWDLWDRDAAAGRQHRTVSPE